MAVFLTFFLKMCYFLTKHFFEHLKVKDKIYSCRIREIFFCCKSSNLAVAWQLQSTLKKNLCPWCHLMEPNSVKIKFGVWSLKLWHSKEIFWILNKVFQKKIIEYLGFLTSKVETSLKVCCEFLATRKFLDYIIEGMPLNGFVQEKHCCGYVRNDED